MARLSPAPLICALIACTGCSAPETDVRVSALTLNDAPPTAAMRAGYLTLTNPGDQPRRLVSVASNGFGLAEIHRTETVDGVARMREIKDLTIAPGQTLNFEPFGRHVMLMRPSAPKTPDEDVTVTLCFDNEQCVVASAERTP
ncbi:MAG: copper chaperone PCu(A)C [Gammaproteobacteria bacterium]